jgi:LysM repeat protein
MSTDTLAAFNGLSSDYMVVEGDGIEIPAPGEAGASAPSSTSTTTSSTSSGASHTVTTGESLSSVAAANGITVSDLAAANGLSTDSMLIAGSTIQVPAASSASTATSSAPATGLGTISTPYGDLYLESSAASEWNAMRQDSIANYGQDLYPAGPLSAYRTTDQQEYLYQLYLSGQGAPANPPGTSTHQLGDSVDLATPEMRSVVDQIGYAYGWGKYEAPDEWWHVSYAGG